MYIFVELDNISLEYGNFLARYKSHDYLSSFLVCQSTMKQL